MSGYDHRLCFYSLLDHIANECLVVERVDWDREGKAAIEKPYRTQVARDKQEQSVDITGYKITELSYAIGIKRKYDHYLFNLDREGIDRRRNDK